MERTRFDRLTVSVASSTSRRRILGGLAGGGTVGIDAGEATLVLFATIMSGFGKNSKRSQVLGRVPWRDPHHPLTLDSTQITAYGPPTGDPNSRRVQSLARVNGLEGVPFHIETRAVESCSASITIDVGDHLLVPDEEVLVSLANPPSGIIYTAKRALVSGGLELLAFEGFKRPNRKRKQAWDGRRRRTSST